MLKDTFSRITVGLLIPGTALIIFSAIILGPTITESSTLGWSTFGLGLLLAFIAGIIYIVGLSFRTASWPEIALPAVITALFFAGYLTWLAPMKGEAVIFHPAMGPALLSALWLAATIYCGFRAAR